MHVPQNALLNAFTVSVLRFAVRIARGGSNANRRDPALPEPGKRRGYALTAGFAETLAIFSPIKKNKNFKHKIQHQYPCKTSTCSASLDNFPQNGFQTLKIPELAPKKQLPSSISGASGKSKN